MGTDPSTMKACRIFHNFPVGTAQGACNYYDRPTLTSTDLKCSNCVSGSGMLCALPLSDDVCSEDPNAPNYGVPVSVKGVIQCAKSGLVANCDYYN